MINVNKVTKYVVLGVILVLLGGFVFGEQAEVRQYTKKDLPEAKVNINTASTDELCKLPGVGPATAKKIIEYRKENLFKAIDEIKNIKGIKEKKFMKMKEYLTI